MLKNMKNSWSKKIKLWNIFCKLPVSLSYTKLIEGLILLFLNNSGEWFGKVCIDWSYWAEVNGVILFINDLDDSF